MVSAKDLPSGESQIHGPEDIDNLQEGVIREEPSIESDNIADQGSQILPSSDKEDGSPPEQGDGSPLHDDPSIHGERKQAASTYQPGRTWRGITYIAATKFELNTTPTGITFEYLKNGERKHTLSWPSNFSDKNKKVCLSDALNSLEIGWDHTYIAKEFDNTITEAASLARSVITTDDTAAGSPVE